MTIIKWLILFLFWLQYCRAFNIFPKNQLFTYKLESEITLVPDYQSQSTDNSMWYINGLVKIQRKEESDLIVQIELDKSSYPNQDAITSLLQPFKVKLVNDSVVSVLFKNNEQFWSANIKRAISSQLQVKGDSTGAYVVNENGIYGNCPTEHYVVNKTKTFYEVSKTYDMENCMPFSGAIYLTRSNIPQNLCVSNNQKQAITSRIANYKLTKFEAFHYILNEIDSTMKTNVRTLESYYPQFLFTKVFLKLESKKEFDSTIDVDTNMASDYSGLLYISPEEPTGGRNPKTSDQLIKRIEELLNKLADSLDANDKGLHEPYDETISEIIRLMGTMDYNALKKLYDEMDIGTSYRQETARNILLEILPRTGTSSTILLTRDLVIGKHILPSTAVQLLMALPFYITDPTADLIKECEVFLNLGPDRPDVRHAAVLSYATMIYNTYMAGKMSLDMFEKYVKTYFDLFLNSFDYEQQMLYLEALGNLQLENVADYLEPIIKGDYEQNTDIRFLAIWATMPTAHTRPEKVYELYWPIFHSKTTPLQLRIAAFTMLLVSNPTPGRLLGLYSVIKNENDPHMLNFYRTTIMSISETTYPCYQPLRHVVAYMTRQIPKAPHSKYWVTGNYLFDYRDRKFHIGSMFQTLLIGSKDTDLPMVAYVKFDTEALGRFTGQLGFYLKARGLSDAITNRFMTLNAESLKIEKLAEILKNMKMPIKTATPLHLEFIVQYEGKAVLSYHLNQTSFLALTDGDLLNRIQTLLVGNNHLNFQMVRRPFMIKYALPTLIGTPADILIENTASATMRGNATQRTSPMEIARSHQIDVRYSSYAVVKIRSYNPIEDIEYSTIREQGFLLYLPINNEIIWDMASTSLYYSFYRPEGLKSGISLKSRTRNMPAKKSVPYEQEPSNEITNYEHKDEELGLDILMGIHNDYTKENVYFMLEADLLDNAKVLTKGPYSFLNNVLKVFSLVQLNTIHIGRNKHMTLIMKNERKLRLEGTFKWSTIDYTKKANASENKMTIVDLTMNNKEDKEGGEARVLSKWELVTKYTSFKNSNAAKVQVSLNAKKMDGSNWRLCINTNHDPLVLLKKPMTLVSSIVFGQSSNPRRCPTDKAKIDLHIKISPDASAPELYTNLHTNDENCPKEIIRLTPPPFSGYCDSSVYANITNLRDYNIELKFERMPEGFIKLANRVDHLISAIVPSQVAKLDISNNLKMAFKMPLNSSKMHVSVNGHELQVPMTQYFDAKSNSIYTMDVDYGYTSTCSIVNNKLYNFYNQIIYLTKEIKDEYTKDGEILLAAECTDSPKFAAFLMKDREQGIKVYTGGNYLTFKPGQDAEINGEERVNLKNGVYQYPQDDFSDFRAYINDENILFIENQLITASVQYDMNSIVQILVSSLHRARMCGLCSLKV